MNSNAKGIAVSGSDVYVCGTINDTTGIQKVFCTKNNVPLILQNSSGANATGLFVDGNNVYVCGNLINNFTPDLAQQACYWKNGNLVKLEDGRFLSEATGITVSNGNTYVCGNVYGQGTYSTAVIWLSGQRQPLFSSTQNANAQSIAVEGSYIYVSGAEFETNLESYQAAYWMNGTPYLLGSTDDESGASSIFVQK